MLRGFTVAQTGVCATGVAGNFWSRYFTFASHGFPVFCRSVTNVLARTFVQISLPPSGHSTTTPSRLGSEPRPKWTRLSLALR